jgi:hypothetical protein
MSAFAKRAGVGVFASVALVGGLAVASAGTDERESTSRRSAVERTIRKAIHVATADRNYKRACRFGTARGRRRLVRGYNSSMYGPDYPNCAAILRSEVEERTRSHRRMIARIRDGVGVKVLWVEDGQARALVGEDEELLAALTIRLRRVDGRWRLDNSRYIPYGD